MELAFRLPVKWSFEKGGGKPQVTVYEFQVDSILKGDKRNETK